MPTAARPISPTTTQKVGRLAQIFLAVAFVLEIAAALDAWAGLSAVANALAGAPSDESGLPGAERLFIYVVSAITVGAWVDCLVRLRHPAPAHGEPAPAETLKKLALLAFRPRDGLSALEAISGPVGQPSGPGHRPLCVGLWASLLATIYGYLFLLTFLVLRSSGIVEGSSHGGGLLALSAAATFFLACLWIEDVDKRLVAESVSACPAALPAQPQSVSAPSPAPAPVARRPVLAAPPPVPSSTPPLPASASTLPSACVLCGEPLSGRRCDACGSAALVGPYRIERLLGRGSFARTYLATAGNEQVVLKEIAFSLAPDVATLEAFEREAELLRQLHHPRIPRFVASLTEGEGASMRLYLAQQYIAGRSLEDEFAVHRYGETEVVEVLRQVLGVLVYLHGLSPRVIHRDLKPANLVRRPNGSLVVVDFGAARELSGTVHSGTMVGTFGYMPPEQLAGQVDETSDLYALGATAIHLLSRRPPWELLGDGAGITLPRSLNVSRPVRKVLQRLVAARRGDRFGSARQALSALERASREAPVPRWWLGAAASVGVAGATFVGLRALSGEPSAPAQVEKISAAASASPEVREPAPSPGDEKVVARYRGGVVTVAELSDAHFGLPPVFRAHPGSLSTEVRDVAARELLFARADRELAEDSEGTQLPKVVRQRRWLREQVDSIARKRAVKGGEAGLSAARLAVLREMVRDALNSAGLEIDESALSKVPSVEPIGFASGEAELSLAGLPDELRDPAQGRHSLRVADDLEDCEIQLDPATSSYGGHCGCDWLPKALFGSEMLYFELFLSGDGPNILRRYNYSSLPCNEILVSSMAPAYLDERLGEERELLDYQFQLTVESIDAPAAIDEVAMARMLLPMRFRLANCLVRRHGPLRTQVLARWQLSPFGSAHDVEIESLDEPLASGVRDCLRPLLEGWRFSSVSGSVSGRVEARLGLALGYPSGSDARAAGRLRVE